jgi:hypothetical protein
MTTTSTTTPAKKPEEKQVDGVFTDEHEAFAASRSSDYVYVPCNEIFFEALDSQADTTGGDVKTPLVVCGSEGSGKSALLANWVLNRRKHKHKDEFLFHYYAECAEETRELVTMLVQLETKLKEHFQLREMNVPDTEERASWALNRFLTAAAKKHEIPRITIVIDGVNLLSSSRAPAGSMHWLPTTANLPNSVRFIVSTLQKESAPMAGADAMVDEEDMPNTKTFTELQRRGYPAIVMEPLSVHVRTNIVRNFATICQLTDKNFEVSESNQFRIVTAYASVSPLYLRCFLCMLRLYNSLSGEPIDALVDLFLTGETARSVVDKALTLCYRAIWEHVGGKETGSDEEVANARAKSEVLMSVLSMIYASRDGLELFEVWDLVRMTANIDIDDGLRKIVTVIIKALTVCINGKYSFSHGVYMDVVFKKYIASKASLNHWHQTMGDYFTRLPVCERKLICLPYHLEEAGASQRVKSCLTDIEMFQLWWTPPFKKDFIKFWLYLLTGESDTQDLPMDAIQPKPPVYDVVDEYVKSLDDYRRKAHPKDEQLTEIVLEIADFLLEFAIDGYEERLDTPTSVHPVVPAEDLKIMGVPCVTINEEGRSTLWCPSVYGNQLTGQEASKDPNEPTAIGGAGKPVDDLPLRTTYYFNRWLWVQFPLIAMGNAQQKLYAAGVQQADKLSYKRGPTDGGIPASPSKSSSGFVFKDPKSPMSGSKSINPNKLKLPDIKFNRRAARSLRRPNVNDEEEAGKDEDRDGAPSQIELRTIALHDSIQNYREEYDFLFQQRNILRKRTYELSGVLKTLVSVGDSCHQYDDDFVAVREREEESRLKKETSLLEEQKLKDIDRLCTRHPAHMPALVFEVEEKIEQDIFLLGEIRKRLFEQYFELNTHKVAFKDMKKLAAEKNNMQDKLLNLRYDGQRAMTQRAQSDMAATQQAANDVRAKDERKLKSTRDKNSRALRRRMSTLQDNELNMSQSFTMTNEQSGELELTPINLVLDMIAARTGLSDPDVFFERVLTSPDLKAQISNLKSRGELRLERAKEGMVTVEKELEDTVYELSVGAVNPRDSQEQRAKIIDSESRVKRIREDVERVELLLQDSKKGFKFISDMLNVKLDVNGNVQDTVKTLERHIAALVEAKMRLDAQMDEAKSGGKKASRPGTGTKASKPSTPKYAPSPSSHAEGAGSSPGATGQQSDLHLDPSLQGAIDAVASPQLRLPNSLAGRSDEPMMQFVGIPDFNLMPAIRDEPTEDDVFKTTLSESIKAKAAKAIRRRGKVQDSTE